MCLNIYYVLEPGSARFWMDHGSCRLYLEQRLIVFYRGRILYQDLYNAAFHFTLDFIEKLHRFDDTDHRAGLHIVADIDKRRLIW